MPVPSVLLHLPRAVVLAGMLAGAVVMLFWRVRESRRPVTTRSILAPPLGMATGFAMFLAPAVRIPWSWAIAAFAVGAVVLSIPLSRTSRLTRAGDAIVMERSRAFLAILVGLVVVRFALRAWIEQVVTGPQTAAIFFILAFGMIFRWRAAMFLDYLRLRAPAVSPVPAADPPRPA
jgi:membrane protein CcdC involved in cytochrome C biogenesis